jgi:hypothetical protein
VSNEKTGRPADKRGRSSVAEVDVVVTVVNVRSDVDFDGHDGDNIFACFREFIFLFSY